MDINSVKKLWLMTAVFFIVFISTSCSSLCQNSIQFEAMNTIVSIRSYGLQAKKANLQARKAILELEEKFSVTKKESLVYRLNQGNVLCPDKEFLDLLQFSLQMAQKTEGIFNPCIYPAVLEWGFTTEEFKIPSEQTLEELKKITDYRQIIINAQEFQLPQNFKLDFGSVGKGLGADKALQVLKNSGIKSAVINLGGNVITLGQKKHKDWNIGIKSPVSEGVFASVKVSDLAVVTSGGYEKFFEADGKKYIHIFDGKKLCPVENEFESVTVICSSALKADALSTAIFAGGLKMAEKLYSENPDFELVLYLKDSRIICTAKIQEVLTIYDDSLSLTSLL